MRVPTIITSVKNLHSLFKLCTKVFATKSVEKLKNFMGIEFFEMIKFHEFGSNSRKKKIIKNGKALPIKIGNCYPQN